MGINGRMRLGQIVRGNLSNNAKLPPLFQGFLRKVNEVGHKTGIFRLPEQMNSLPLDSKLCLTVNAWFILRVISGKLALRLHVTAARTLGPWGNFVCVLRVVIMATLTCT